MRYNIQRFNPQTKQYKIQSPQTAINELSNCVNDYYGSVFQQHCAQYVYSITTEIHMKSCSYSIVSLSDANDYLKQVQHLQALLRLKLL